MGAALSCAAQADALAPDGFAIAAGSAQAHTPIVGASLVWKTGWERRLDRGRVDLRLELGLASLGAARHEPGGTVSQLSFIPFARWTPASVPAGPGFFLEAGVGLSVFDRQYVHGNRSMASRWNFEDVLGAGVSFGPTRSHEIGVRATHISNGGLRKPNPGLNGVQVRYAASF